MSTFTAVLTSHANPDGLSYMLRSLDEQTRRPDEVLIYASDTPGFALFWPSMDCLFSIEPNLNDWGHAKRAEGLRRASGDYVGFFNDDDSYDPNYIAIMMAVAEEQGADAVYCDWSGVPNCSFCLGSSTSGNYIVRTGLGRQVGYTDRHYEADGTFIDRIREAEGAYGRRSKVVKVHKLLYRHNQQPW